MAGNLADFAKTFADDPVVLGKIQQMMANKKHLEQHCEKQAAKDRKFAVLIEMIDVQDEGMETAGIPRHDKADISQRLLPTTHNHAIRKHRAPTVVMASTPAPSDQPPDHCVDLQHVPMETKEHVRQRKKTGGVIGTSPTPASPTSGDPVHPTHRDSDILYGVDDRPPWYTSLILGFQHYLLMFGGSVSLPLLITPVMCIGNDDVGKSEVIGTAFFISGLSTLLQTTLGTRLPIVQGGSFAFLPPLFAILSLPKWECPQEPDFSNMTTNSSSNESLLLAWRRQVWTSRMREVQGAIAVASVFQVLVGLTGVLGLLLRFIGPLAIAPTICLIGLHLYVPAANYCAKQWGIAFMTIFFIILFSQYVRNIRVPFPRYSRQMGWHWVGYPVFKLLPVFLSIIIVWATCAALTAWDVFPSDSDLPGYGARTDTKLHVLVKAQWFRFPYPGQWGMPTVSAAAVLGMLAGVVSGMVESVGDYYACARLAGALPPPIHAINRGILFEGIGITCAGLWGSGSGVTSFSENIGAIGITKVASRHVIQVGALIMVFFGLFGKLGALFVTIPEPIIGGIFMVVFGMITAVGVSNLQFVDLNSSRNLFVFGFALFLGMSLPTWVSKHPKAISTGVMALDQVITVLLSTNMFVGGFVGFLLDNTIPGTPEERGILLWRNHGKNTDVTNGPANSTKCPYDFPFGMGYLRKSRWSNFLPICPTYSPSCCKGDVDVKESKVIICDKDTVVGIDNPTADIQPTDDIRSAENIRHAETDPANLLARLQRVTEI